MCFELVLGNLSLICFSPREDILQYILVYRDAFILICKNMILLGVALTERRDKHILPHSACAKTLETFVWKHSLDWSRA